MDEKFTKEWRKREGILFSVSYHYGENSFGENDPDPTMLLTIYDKSGNPHSKIELDKKMMLDLKQDIDICLGLIKEMEDD